MDTPPTIDPQGASPARGPRFWLRPLAIALAGVLLLGGAGAVALHFVHSDLPASSVSCLDSTCTSGMPMSGHMGSVGMEGEGGATNVSRGSNMRSGTRPTGVGSRQGSAVATPSRPSP